MLQHFSRQEASSILNIKAGRLQYWNRIGLVKPSLQEKGKTCYSFQDLICLKTAEGLVGQGLPARKIKLRLDTLRKKIPEWGDLLNNKRIYVFGNRVLVRHKNHLIDSLSGQLFFKFDADDLAAGAETRVRSFTSNRRAEDWFQEALRYDGNRETYEQALHAYHNVLKLDPDYSDAHVNIGTIYYNQGKFTQAERSYRLALEQDPYHAEAYFNLGNVMDELGKTREAVQCYEKALQLDPSYPDANYNLASACEKLELWERALAHWGLYLNFDGQSEYASCARKRIEVLKVRLRTARSAVNSTPVTTVPAKPVPYPNGD